MAYHNHDMEEYIKQKRNFVVMAITGHIICVCVVCVCCVCCVCVLCVCVCVISV